MLFVNFYATSRDSSEIKMRKSVAMNDNTVRRAGVICSKRLLITWPLSSAVYTFSI
jgi:hypothetical protein